MEICRTLLLGSFYSTNRMEMKECRADFSSDFLYSLNVAFFQTSVTLLYRQLQLLQHLNFGVLLMTGFKNPAPIVSEDPNAVRFGFTPQSENWNGRLAMIGFLSAILIEAFSGQGLLHFWGIL